MLKRILKEMKWDALLTGILYVLLGVMALALPETMERILGYMIGVVLIVGGAVSMIGYLLRDARQNYYHNDFLHGLISIAAGILVLIKMEVVIGLISFLLGVMVLVSGCSKLQDVIDMKRLECGNWIVMLVLAALNVGFGIFLICNPFSWTILLFRLLGIGLIFSGILDCVAIVYFAGKIRKYLDDITAVDSTYVEMTETETKKSENRKKPMQQGGTAGASGQPGIPGAAGASGQPEVQGAAGASGQPEVQGAAGEPEQAQIPVTDGASGQIETPEADNEPEQTETPEAAETDGT